MAATMTRNTLWLDIGDLLRFFAGHPRPTGIQRFSLETARALNASSAGVRFCAATSAGWVEVAFARLDAAIAALSAQALPPAPPRGVTASPWPKMLIEVAKRLPVPVRLAVGRLGRAGLEAGRAGADLARSLARPRLWRASGLGGQDFARGPVAFVAGDWLVGLGASWEQPPSQAEIVRLKALGVRLGWAVHDLIPLLLPEFCLPAQGRDLRGWLEEIAVQADVLFAVSHHTAADLRGFLGARAPRIEVLPMGGGELAAFADNSRVPEQKYVLMVGTIEARKNHAGALRMWRRLIEAGGEVPKLVVAGKRGWLADDVLAQIEHSDGLNGHVVLVEQPTDAELRALYEGCLFSIFPSFYEGWGLPVSEALSYGVPVLASNAGAIPEAGAEFCGYFDPDDGVAGAKKVARWVAHPEEVAALRARIRAEYKRPAWADTARVFGLLGDTSA